MEHDDDKEEGEEFEDSDNESIHSALNAGLIRALKLARTVYTAERNRKQMAAFRHERDQQTTTWVQHHVIPSQLQLSLFAQVSSAQR